ncbi:tryptophan 2,3-dioxygenase family protein [Nonomuraea soli]|uniref:Tryptophan 2,3-dioxygenase n=1 Tax=Nonomuraea soli TaxID=1032476 RepID=A0A7W0HPH4_9ACTN|nr:tryptophan 2,3-dioxygenase family protein [Nonomuraea soli]MBA2890859.1 tryptophan 2,3-dioxygenase [Nonomuraea soli]
MTDTAQTQRHPAYGEILRLDELLDIACVRDDADRTLFFASHQACEIWFAVVLRHLDEARQALLDGDGIPAAEHLERLPHIMEVITNHIDILGTLAPRSFDEIRATLGTSSGFQSAQYREIEYLCGARDRRFLNISGLTEAERDRLLDRLAQKSLSSVFVEYRDSVPPASLPARRVRDALRTFDNSVRVWQERHAEVAELFLGAQRGTAGSTGAAYLRRSAARTMFPEVFPDQWRPFGGEQDRRAPALAARIPSSELPVQRRVQG